MDEKTCLNGCYDDATCLHASYAEIYHPLQPAMDAVPGKPAIAAKEAVPA